MVHGTFVTSIISTFVIVSTAWIQIDIIHHRPEVTNSSSSIPAQEFQCNDLFNSIIDQDWVCDDEVDCLNGLDEHMSTCNKSECYHNEKECGSTGVCILEQWHCDGTNDCLDYEDEVDCAPPDIDYENVSCSEDTWKCNSSASNQCIEQYAVCDGVMDCADGSDETRETCQHLVYCAGNSMPCFNPTVCIPDFWQCDGKNDCSDGSDEIGCDDEAGKANHSCPNGEVACSSIFKEERCVPLSAQCDGVSDCRNNEDEGMDCSIACEQIPDGTENTCSQKCHRTPHGPMCTCIDGYSLGEDNRTCLDINECSSPTLTPCEQICVNTPGSYQCQCINGFGLTLDKQRCKPHGKDLTYLFFGNHNEVQRMILAPLEEGRTNGSRQFHRYETVHGLNINSDALVADIDYLYDADSIFWLEKMDESTTLKSKDRDGNIIKIIETNNSLVLQRISIDWIGMNVFFTAIDMSSPPNGIGCTTSCGRIGLVPIKRPDDVNSLNEIHGIAESLGNLLDIIVIANKGVVITCEYDALGRILAIAADGSDIKVLKRYVLWPNALAYDDTTNNLYWSQAPPSSWLNKDNFQIRSMSLSNTKDEKLIISRAHPYFKSAGSIAYFEGRIRWYDMERTEVISANARNGKNAVVLAKIHHTKNKTLTQIPMLISHPMLQTKSTGDSAWCEALDCQYTCVMAATDLDVLERNSSLVPQCICPEDKFHFTLSSSCKVHAKFHFIIIDNGYLRKIYDVGPQSLVQQEDHASAYAIVYDPNRERIYYMDMVRRSIRYIATNVSNSNSVTFIEDVTPTKHFTIDPTTGTIYWVASCSIMAAIPLVGSKLPYVTSTIFVKDLSCPEGLAFDSHRSRLYFVIMSSTPYLYSINADGSDIRLVRTVASTQTVRHMIFDPYVDRIVYLAKSYTGIDYIESLDLKSQKIFVYSTFSNNAETLAVTSKRLVVYDPSEGMLITQRKSKVGDSDRVNIKLEAWAKANNISGRGGMTYVDSSHDDFRNTSNPCSPSSSLTSPCTHFCFPSSVKPERYTCGCPDFYNLNKDGYTCEKSVCRADQFYCHQYNMTKDVKRQSLPEEYPDCISQLFTCDRNKADCYDGSDESVELCGCEEPYFKECRLPGDNSATNVQCVRSDMFCNGYVDCVNGADERNCSCDQKTEFQCPPHGLKLSTCIPLAWVEDGFNDCRGGEDEVNRVCSNDEFGCDFPPNCVSWDFVCDGFYDCHDKSDESNCTGKPDQPVIATNTTQVPATMTTSSTSVPCSLHHFECNDGGCLSNTSLVCNGVADCSDSSDEGENCSFTCEDFTDVSRHCLTKCYQSPRGPTCLCPLGYKYDFSAERCEDINECSLGMHNCEHTCVNIGGSYKCECNEGYSLDLGYKCKAQGNVPFYLMATENQFRIASFRGNEYYEPVHLDFHNVQTPTNIRPSHFALRGENRFYWIDNESHRLYVTRTWSGNTTLLTHSIPNILALCWDWGGKKLFWATEKSIDVVTQIGQYSATIISSQSKINGMIIDPIRSTLVYSSVNSSRAGRLTLCSLGGEGCRIFGESSKDIFRTLTIDYVKNTLYWVSHYSNTIEKSSMSGFKREMVYQYKRANIISGLSVFEYKVAWIESDVSQTEIDGNGAIRVNKRGERHNGRAATLFMRRENQFEVMSRLAMRQLPISAGLGIIQEWSQPPIKLNLCDIFTCTFFCWTQSIYFCSCAKTRLHSTSSFPSRHHPLCSDLDFCPTPPLSVKGTRLNLQSNNTVRDGDVVYVSCPGEDELHKLICKSDGSWTTQPKCQNDYQSCKELPIGNSTVSTIANPNAVKSSRLYWEGALVSVSCKEGFSSKSGQQNVTVECGSDGQWKGGSIKCVRNGKKTITLKTAASHESLIIPLVVVIVVVLVVVMVSLVWWFRKKGNCLKSRKRGSFSIQPLSTSRNSVSETNYYDNPLTVLYKSDGDENGYATIGMRGPNST